MLRQLAMISMCSFTVACVLGDEAEPEFTRDRKLVARGVDEPIAVPAKGKLVYELIQPELLARLERDGWAVSRPFGAEGMMSNADLYLRSRFYKGVVDALTKDVNDRRAADAGLTTSVIFGRDRVFDPKWLRSPYATFDLTAVLNRIDRKDFDAPGTSCGEVRFVYRLSYVKDAGNVTNFSRMPFAFNVIYTLPPGTDGTCAEQQRRWLVDRDMTAEEFVRFVETTSLDRSQLTFKQVEVNAQVIRVPSENKTDMGGAAEYFLRIYREKNGITELRSLENTPNVAALTSNRALRDELAGWIKDNLPAIDRGTAVIPAKFLASKVASFTTFGSARRSNKLFSTVFTAADFAGVDFSGTQLVASPQGLLARLDDMTCSGCHQSRSVAGFHMLGLERGTQTHPLNALHTYASPHYLSDRQRRSTYGYTILAGASPNPFRPLSFATADNQDAKVGMTCIADGDRRHFKKTFKCGAGSQCDVLASNAEAPIDLGQCMPSSGGFAGLPCLAGELVDRARPRDDSLGKLALGCEAGYFCLDPEEGTPGGMCSGRCSTIGRLTQGGREICAFGANGERFDACAASQNIASCIEDAVVPAPRTACDENLPCREDYMCQRLVPLADNSPIKTTPTGKGFCNPTYFIFQMRLDGHPPPL